MTSQPGLAGINIVGEGRADRDGRGWRGQMGRPGGGGDRQGRDRHKGIPTLVVTGGTPRRGGPLGGTEGEEGTARAGGDVDRQAGSREQTDRQRAGEGSI